MSHSRKSCCLEMKRQKEFSAAASNRGKRFSRISFFSWLHCLVQESKWNEGEMWVFASVFGRCQVTKLSWSVEHKVHKNYE